MTPTPRPVTGHPDSATLRRALAAPQAPTRLRAAMAVGTGADPELIDTLVSRCAVEPDFFVRDMLTWALTRMPRPVVVDRLRPELESASLQARSQALHTLSKLGAPRTWWWVTDELLTHDDDEVARSAWRAAVTLTPVEDHPELVGVLVGELGRGDRDRQLSLSRALVGFGAAITAATETAAVSSSNPDVAAHARATMALMDDPDLGFDAAIHEARRVAALGPEFG